MIEPRSDIERHFAWAKRYFGLKYFQIEGWLNVMTYACCIYIAILAVAVVAYRCQRPELARSRTQVLGLITQGFLCKKLLSWVFLSMSHVNSAASPNTRFTPLAA